MTTFRRLRAVLGLDKNDDPGLLQRVKAIHAALLEHADTFAAPTPALPVLLGKISVFEQATQEPERGSKGARRCGTPKRPSSCWRSLPPTAHGHVDFEERTPGQAVTFRVRFIDLKGAHAWSQVVSYVVR